MTSITLLMVFGVASYFYFAHDLPSIETLKNYKPSTVTKIFSEDGEIIGEFFYEKREVVSLDRIPNHLIQAFVAGEDARFFQHKGWIIWPSLGPFLKIFSLERLFKEGAPLLNRW